jgi:hypothetical protein
LGKSFDIVVVIVVGSGGFKNDDLLHLDNARDKSGYDNS